MINKYFDGQVPTFVANVTDFDADLAVVAENLASYHKYMEAVDYPRALKLFGISSPVPTSTSMKQHLGSWQRRS